MEMSAIKQLTKTRADKEMSNGTKNLQNLVGTTEIKSNSMKMKGDKNR